jgi:hypothetical protein
MPFQKGQSGNPHGRRPKSDLERRDEHAARRHSAAAISTLVRNLECGKPQAEVQAAKEILDRAWGKPKQRVDLDGAIGVAITKVERVIRRANPENRDG